MYQTRPSFVFKREIERGWEGREVVIAYSLAQIPTFNKSLEPLGNELTPDAHDSWSEFIDNGVMAEIIGGEEAMSENSPNWTGTDEQASGGSWGERSLSVMMMVMMFMKMATMTMTVKMTVMGTASPETHRLIKSVRSFELRPFLLLELWYVHSLSLKDITNLFKERSIYIYAVMKHIFLSPHLLVNSATLYTFKIMCYHLPTIWIPSR